MGRTPPRSWRVPNLMLQYADIQFLEGLVSYFGHGLSTMLHDQSLSSFCHELSDNVKWRERELNLTPQYAHFQLIKRTLLSKSTR